MRVLAQVASALEAVHAAGGVHRDVRGDNLLVRPEDGHVVLVDFGSCTFRGAPVLTRGSEPPTTPRYQSPQAQLHQWRFRRQRSARYEASPADDVYGLGVTAYRLVTGRYPLIAESMGADDGQEEVFSRFPELVPADALVQLSPELARWTRQMLRVQPEARGSSAELAVGLKLSANTEGPEADRPVGSPVAPKPVVSAEPTLPREEAAPPRASRPVLPWHMGLGIMAAGIVMVVLGGGLLHALLEPSSVMPPSELARAVQLPAREGKNSALGEASPSEPLSSSGPTPVHEGVSAPVPAQPLPGQRVPPCKKPLVEINGGCWFRVGDDEPPCSDVSYEWRRQCYAPAFGSSRPLNTKER